MAETKATVDQALRIARSAAAQLQSDLSDAERLPNAWSNESLALRLVAKALGRCLETLETTGWIGRESQLISSEFWRLAGPILKCGSLQLRAREKPRGYAGDFETLELLHNRQVCEHPLGRLFDLYFQNQIAVEAVRSRTELVAAHLTEAIIGHSTPNFRIASIGSGPAIDLELAIRRLSPEDRSRILIQLFDLEEAALQSARNRLLATGIAESQIETRRENLYRLAELPSVDARFRSAHFISCAGLFDYLPDAPAIAMLRFLRRKLSSPGQLMVGNFSPQNPSRAYMEWIGNWYLIYRTPGELDELAVQAGIGTNQFRVEAERTGVDLFLVATKGPHES